MSMESITTLSVLIGILGSVFAIVMAILNYTRLKLLDRVKDTNDLVEMKIEMKSVNDSLDRINDTLDDMGTKFNTLMADNVKNITNIENMKEKLNSIEKRVARNETWKSNFSN